MAHLLYRQLHFFSLDIALGICPAPQVPFALMATAYRRKRLMEGIIRGDKEVSISLALQLSPLWLCSISFSLCIVPYLSIPLYVSYHVPQGT